MRIGAAAALLFLSVAGGAARAQDEEPSVAEARSLFEQGSALAAQRRFAEAVEAFRSSLALLERPTTLWNLGVCLRELGHHVEAIGVLQRYLSIADAVADPEGFASAERMLAASRSRAGEITLHVEPADAEVTLDGLALEGGATRTATVDPGSHAVRITATGRAPRLLELEVGPGQRVQRAVDLEPVAAPTALVIRSADRRAALLLDGEEIGRGTARVELAPGSHEITMRPERRIDRAPDRERRGVSPVIFWTTVALAIAAVAAGLSVGLRGVGDRGSADGGSTGVVLRPPVARNLESD